MSGLNGKIGLFDSGFGGLTILKHLAEFLPQYDYLYLGDSARAPYGEKSHDQIFEFTKQGVKFLFDKGVDIVVLACNSASAQALRQIQKEFLPECLSIKRVLGVIIPTAEEAIGVTKNKKIAILATQATVNSCTFEKEINKLDSNIAVNSLSAPLLVPMIENGEYDKEENENIIKKYVEEALSNGADTLILGCTHYGILKEKIKKYSGGVNIVSEEEIISIKFNNYLQKHKEIESKLSKGGSVEFFTTGDIANFDKFGTQFFGGKVEAERVIL